MYPARPLDRPLLMIAPLVAALALVTAVLSVYVYLFRQTRTELERLRRQLHAQQAMDSMTLDAVQATRDGHPLIAVEVLNPLSLAADRHPLGAALGRVTPSLTRRIVFQKTAEELQKRLAAEGVESEVRLINR